MTVINTNIKSLVARDALATNNRQLATAMERLSTGKRINSASDDAAGLSISSRMDSQVRGLQMAVKNSNDAISVTQTAEGAMQEINNILQRMRELAVQSSNDSNSAEDRVFLQAEVAQLSDEIDRIATTTQFNGINILDGGFANKSFQIGANSGQTMSISVGDMRASVLGVGVSDVVGSSGTSASTATSEVVTVKAAGTAATQTQARLLFGDIAAGGASAGFDITDSVSGITYSHSGTLDVNSSYSKDDFLVALNAGLRQAAQDTVLTGEGSHTVATTTETAIADITDVDSFDSMKFAIKLDAGDPYQNIDIRQRLNSTSLAADGAPTFAEVAAAIQSELRAAFADDDQSLSVVFNTTSDAFVITDKEGRSIEVFQGAGDGFLFGTDLDNSGSLSVDATIHINITAAWDGNAIVLTNAAGGDITVDDVSYTGSSITFDAADGQESQVDPVYYAAANSSSISSSDGNEARFQGVTEASSMSLLFSNRVGDPGGTDAFYKFKITNAAGDVYADFTVDASTGVASTYLDVHEDRSAADIVADVRAALSAGIAANMSADNTIDISEFEISFSNGSLSITNTAGRSLAIKAFDSDVGTMAVVPTNELGAAETLASQRGLFSTTRISVNTAFFGMTASADSAGDLLFTLNGMTIGVESAGEGIVLDMTTGYADGAALALAIESAIQGATQATIFVNGNEVTAGVDLSTISVDWDADTGEIVLSDSLGRAMGFGLRSTNTFAGSGMVFDQDFVQGSGNDTNVVKVASSAIQGDVYEATKVTMTLNTASEATFNFSINGQALSSTTYDPSDVFAGSDLQTALDAMMVALNGAHGSDVFEYSVSGAQMTIWQRDGGPVEVSDFATSGVGDDALTLTIAGADGQGETVVAYETDATASATASTASGVLASRTEATLTLSNDDVYSMVISDGTNDYSLSSTVVDLSDSTSVQNFTNALEVALDGSGIVASMDLSGKVYLTRSDGGEIGLKSFTSGSGNTATWTPKSGQGEVASLDGSGSLTSTVTSTTSNTSGSTSTSTVGTVSVSQISIATQEDAAAALDVLDDALTYVNSERSKLGAIENRLSHTIDNLTNVITNTQASRSRIVDADYAAETSELARTQIIQQAATAMLAQANQSSQSVLSLLQ